MTLLFLLYFLPMVLGILTTLFSFFQYYNFSKKKNIKLDIPVELTFVFLAIILSTIPVINIWFYIRIIKFYLEKK